MTGPMAFAEKMVLAVFGVTSCANLNFRVINVSESWDRALVCGTNLKGFSGQFVQGLIVLWMTRSLTDDIPGWAVLFDGKVGDGTC